MRGIKLRNAVTPNGTSLRNVVPWLRRPQRLTAAQPHRSFERVKECLRASLLLIAVVSPSVCKAEHGRAVTPEIESLFNDRDSWASGDVTITGTHYSGERFSETMRVTFDEGFRKVRCDYVMPGREVRFARNDRDSVLYVAQSRVVVRDVPDRKWGVPHAAPFDVRIVGFTTYSSANARESFPEVAALIRSHAVDLIEVCCASFYLTGIGGESLDLRGRPDPA